MNLTRQPLLLALLTLLALLLATFLFGEPLRTAGGPHTLLAGELLLWQTAWPRAARCLCGLLLVSAALTVGRMGVRYNLYAGGSLLAIPLFGIIACSLFLPDDLLAGSAAAFLLSRVVRNYCASYRTGYAFSSIFRGSLYLGALPLLYAPALLLFLLLPLAAFFFKRTIRELIVALGGLALPLAAFCYLHWAFGGSIAAPALQLLDCLTATSGLRLLGSASWLSVLQLIVLLATVLCAFFHFLNDLYASSSKARAILKTDSWLLLLCCATLLLPGSSALFFPLVAVPASLLAPFLFTRLGTAVANSLYGFILLLTILRFCL